MKKHIVLNKYLPFLLQVILIASILVVFYPTFAHDYLYKWDDQWQVLNSYTFGGLHWDNLSSIFFGFYKGQYSPLNQLFYTIVCELFGSKPLFFHVLNLCWHMGCVLLVFKLIRQVLLLCGEKDNTKVLLIAFGVSLLMGIHPVQVESVAWISASKVLSFTFFFLLGLVSYLSFLKRNSGSGYIVSLVCFLLSFLCKEQAIVFPVCLLLIDFLVGRKVWSKDVWIEKVPFFMLSCCFVLITLASYSHTSVEMLSGGDIYPIQHRIAFTGYSITEYITKLLCPVNLLYMYPYPIQAGEQLPVRFWFYPLVLIIMIILLWIGRKHKILIFGSLFFFVQLLLTLHIIPMPRATIVADRYLYMACIGFFFIVVWYLAEWMRYLLGYQRKIIIAVCFLLILFMGFYSNIHCRIWKDDASLKQELRLMIKEREVK